MLTPTHYHPVGQGGRRLPRYTCRCGAKSIGPAWFGEDFQCARCSTEYNSAGQALAPRAQWGEETGETYADLCVGWGSDY